MNDSGLELPTVDPGLHLGLKYMDSLDKCYTRLRPHMLWLVQFVHANRWLDASSYAQFDKYVPVR